jgi:uncharacterized protein DUF1737
MNYVIDYKTIEGQRIGDLDQRVREQIAEGYQPYGNPYTFEINFYQAMIKTSDRDVYGARRGF